MAGIPACPSCSQKAADIPGNVAANATLRLSPAQVSWIGHSRDRSLPPERRPKSRRMPNMAWDHLLCKLALCAVDQGRLPTSSSVFPKAREGTLCSLFGLCPLCSVVYECHSELLFTILLLAHREVHQDPVHVMTHPRRQPQHMGRATTLVTMSTWSP